MQSQPNPRAEYNKQDLIDCGNGKLFDYNSPQLPLPPLLMFDRVTRIAKDGGNYGKGFASAELDINAGLWFFDYHFKGDPVMPGCFSIEGLWQLAGFYLAWLGLKGNGRVVESGSTRFLHSIKKEPSVVEYQIHIKRIFERTKNSTTGGALVVADGVILNQGVEVCRTRKLMIGLSECSQHSRAAAWEKPALSNASTNSLVTAARSDLCFES